MDSPIEGVGERVGIMRLTGSGVKSCKSRTLGKLFGSLRMKSCRSSRNIRPSKILKKLVEEILEAVVNSRTLGKRSGSSRVKSCKSRSRIINSRTSRKRRGGGGRRIRRRPIGLTVAVDDDDERLTGWPRVVDLRLGARY